MGTPSTHDVVNLGFDLTLPCGTQPALAGVGYTREEVHRFAKELGIPVRRKTLDCLCAEVAAMVAAKDHVGRTVVRNTHRNAHRHTTPEAATQYSPLATPALSPAVTPIPFTRA